MNIQDDFFDLKRTNLSVMFLAGWLAGWLDVLLSLMEVMFCLNLRQFLTNIEPIIEEIKIN